MRLSSQCCSTFGEHCKYPPQCDFNRLVAHFSSISLQNMFGTLERYVAVGPRKTNGADRFFRRATAGASYAGEPDPYRVEAADETDETDETDGAKPAAEPERGSA